MIVRSLLATAAAMLIAGSAHAQTTPQECSAIGDSLQRLTCFDKLFPKGTEPKNESAETNEDNVSNWELTEERSPIDDSPRVTAFLLPRDSQAKTLFIEGPSLVLRCRDNVTSAFYNTGKFSINDRYKVTYRVAGNPPKTESWYGSTSRKSAGLWDGGKAIPFLKQLKNDQSLAIQTDDPRTEAVFDLGNVEEVVGKISDACGWK